MSFFPATVELIAFSVCLLALVVAVRSSFQIAPWFRKKVEQFLSRIVIFFHFPRKLILSNVSALPPLRRITLGRVFHRFKFTLFMLFLNIYTFIFTNDLTNGEINPEVLENRGFSYLHFAHHKWFILFTSNFIHFQLPHLAINMLMLLAFSGSLELLKGSHFAAITFLVSMNSNVPNGLFLLPVLKVLYPQIWSQTVHYVDVGASLGIMGSLGGLARLLKLQARRVVLGIAMVGALVGALYIHNLFGIDHAFSVVIGYITADYMIRKTFSKDKKTLVSLAHDSESKHAGLG